MNLQKINDVVKKAKYFSGVIQILEKGEVKLNAASGYAKREDEIDNNVDTAFGIASGTKGFTALGILRLIDKGKLSLEDKVFEILPYEFPNMDNSITVRQLLSHTSGIHDYFDEDVVEDFGQLFEKLPVHKILGPKGMLPLLVEGESYFKPGERFKYCNSAFVILGMLIEVVSGMYYGEYINNEVCKPLGLKKTGCFRTNQLPKNCAYGYIQDENGLWSSNIFEIPIVCTGDGGIYTTADDIAKMWTGMMSGNFLSKNLSTEIFKTQAEAWDHIDYGLGFWIKKNEEWEVSNYYLVGGDPGVCFHSKFYVDKDMIVTILGNTSDGADTLLKEITPYLD